jgi:molybdopterin molybdotransferase
VTLKIVGEVAAGQSAARGVAPGEAMAIMTGAPMPEGADGVVPVEDTERAGDDVRILRATSPGRFISKRGNDLRRGAVAVRRGARLGPAQLAAAASVGAARVRVHSRPRAAVLATGDELVPVEQAPGPSQIRNSNSVMLVALLKRLGCEAIDLGVVRDTPEAVRAALQNAMDTFDVVFVTGGMSMGAYDYVPRTLIELGVDLRITKLRIKPGKPFVFGVKGERFVFGLPGNPVSGFVCTVRLASRLLERMSGAHPHARWITAELLFPLAANGPREFYQPASLSAKGVAPMEWIGSADVYTLAMADALLVRAANEPALAPGASVRVLELPS